MAFLSDNVLDNGIQYIDTNCDNLFICSTEPTTYTEAITTYALGNKNSVTIAAPTDGTPNGRSVEIAAITDGTVSATGTAAFWALVDSSGTELIATNDLGSTQAVTSGNTFTLNAFMVRIPDPV